MVGYSQVNKNGNVYKIEKKQNKEKKYTQTAFIYEDSKGVRYPINISESGAVFVFKTSKKTGKEYKYYLPKEIKTSIWKELKFTPKKK